MPKLRNSSKGRLRTRTLDCESGIHPMSCKLGLLVPVLELGDRFDNIFFLKTRHLTTFKSASKAKNAVNRCARLTTGIVLAAWL